MTLEYEDKFFLDTLLLYYPLLQPHLSEEEKSSTNHHEKSRKRKHVAVDEFMVKTANI